MSGTIAAPPSARATTSSGAPPDPSVDPKIWQAAKQFEAMAIGQMLAPMFDTVDVAHSLFGGGEAEAAWRPMLVDAIGQQIEARGGFGLAQPVYAAMLRAQEGGAQAGRTPRVPAMPPTAAQPSAAHPPAASHVEHQPRTTP